MFEDLLDWMPKLGPFIFLLGIVILIVIWESINWIFEKLFGVDGFLGRLIALIAVFGPGLFFLYMAMTGDGTPNPNPCYGVGPSTWCE